MHVVTPVRVNHLWALIRLPVFVVVAVATVGCAGLTTATLVTAGTVAGAATAAVTTGSEVYRLGKLNGAEFNDLHSVVSAMREAVDELQLAYTSPPMFSPDGLRWTAVVSDERGAKVQLVATRHTPMLTRTLINVGWFGSETTARLIFIRVRHHLHPEADAPADNEDDPNPV